MNYLKNFFQTAVLAAVLIFSFSFFQSTPLEDVFFKIQAVYLVWLSLYLVFILLAWLALNKGADAKQIYFAVLFLSVPAWSAWRAYAEFGQPLIYGWLACREWLIGGVGLWLFRKIICGRDFIEILERAFIFLAWASMAFFLILIGLVYLGWMPDSLTQSGMIVDDEFRGLRFKFQLFFVLYGAVYYWIKFSSEKRPTQMLSAAAFTAYIVFIAQGRTQMFFMAAAFFMYRVWGRSWRYLLITAIQVAAVLGVFIIFLKIVFPEFFLKMIFLFKEMIVVLSGAESADNSANARLFTVWNVKDYFHSHPAAFWLGAGNLSYRWNDGFESVFGYFYPSDIGTLGGIFMCGIAGLVFIVIVPLFISVRALNEHFRLRVSKSVFVRTMMFFLIYAVVRCVQGAYYFSLPSYVIPLFVLFADKTLEEGPACE